jgi:Ca-activated chloride channel family protein
MKKRLTLLAIIVLVSWMAAPLLAQTPVSTPELVVKEGSRKTPLTLTGFRAEVTINGFIAETKVTMTFYNPHKRVLEGDFNFPLPEGSFVSGYALDINGVMVDGVVVEKQKGRVVFEKIVRQGIDPGLVEWVEGNNFRTRIFPIPARGSRTVSVRYISEITFKNREPYFYLPFGFKKKIKTFSIRVEVVRTDREPKIERRRPANFKFKRWHSGFKAETTLKNYRPPEDLIIALPQPDKGIYDQDVLVEKSSEGDYYFCIRDWIKKSKKVNRPISKNPRHITILWDASGSMGKYSHQEELKLLKAYLSGLRGKIITVDLILFTISAKNPNILPWRKAVSINLFE